MTRTGDGPWSRFESTFHQRRSAEDRLTSIEARRLDWMSRRQNQVNTEADSDRRARQQEALELLRATEYAIFHRRVPGFTRAD